MDVCALDLQRLLHRLLVQEVPAYARPRAGGGGGGGGSGGQGQGGKSAMGFNSFIPLAAGLGVGGVGGWGEGGNAATGGG